MKRKAQKLSESSKKYAERHVRTESQFQREACKILYQRCGGGRRVIKARIGDY